MGKQRYGAMKDYGKLIDIDTNCVIRGTMFPHKNIHKLTWKSPDSSTTNQIDHIFVNGGHCWSLPDVRADVYTDHYLVTTTIKFKLTKVEDRERHLDAAKLLSPNTAKESGSPSKL